MGRFFCFALLMLIFNTLVSASDLEREKRLSDEIVDIIFDGEVQMLRDGGREFLGIYTQAEGSKYAALVLHGRGFHPDWVDVVQPLRVGLVEYGWNTLAIQLPVLTKDAKYYDYLAIFDEAIPRIKAGLDFLKSQGKTDIVIVAHSCGVHMSMHYIRQLGDAGLVGYVGIGMGATDYKQVMPQPFPLESMSIPVFDVYGANDFPAVHRLAPGRLRQVQQAGNPLSGQLVIDDSDHYFTNRGAVLLQTVGSWLGQLQLK